MAILCAWLGRGLSSEGGFQPLSIGSASDRLVKGFPPNETAGEGTFDGLLKLFLAHPARGNIKKRAERRRDPEPRSLFNIRWGKGCLVEHAPGGRVLSELWWNGQVDFAREELRESVEDQRRFVGDDGLWLVPPISAPQAQPHKVIVFPKRYAREAVEAVLYPLKVSD